MKKIFFIVLILLSFEANAAFHSPNTDKKAMVVSAQYLATQVGVEILQQGGNAIDAAVAMGYALAVVHPCCGNLGGGGFMLIHLANGKNTLINFREKAPALLKPELFIENNQVNRSKLSQGHALGGSGSYLGVAIPGTVMGLNTALAEYGHFPLKKVIAPAIQLAQQGYILQQGDIELLQTGFESFKTQKNVADIFLENNQTRKAGSRLIQKNLAQSLEKIAAGGTSAFYQGEIAKKIVMASRENGGVITEDDFRHYRIREVSPLHCHYHQYDILTTPPPGGGLTLCEILGIVEPYPISQWGFHSLASLQVMLPAMKIAYEDRNHYLADPEFINIPTQKLLSPDYFYAARKNISDLNLKIKISKPLEAPNTTSYVVVDGQGNAVSVTYTINNYFGARVIAKDTGFFLNNEIDDFTIKADTPNSFKLLQGQANLLAPNKRPASSMAPTMLFRNKQLQIIIGTPGGSTIPSQLAETLQNIIDFKMNLQQALDAPRYHYQGIPNIVFLEPGSLSAGVIAEMQTYYNFQQGSPWGSRQWGAVTAIVKDSNNQGWLGAMDYRKPAGSAVGLNEGQK